MSAGLKFFILTALMITGPSMSNRLVIIFSRGPEMQDGGHYERGHRHTLQCTYNIRSSNNDDNHINIASAKTAAKEPETDCRRETEQYTSCASA